MLARNLPRGGGPDRRGRSAEGLQSAAAVAATAAAALLLVLSVAVFCHAVFPTSFGVWARRTLALSDELWPRQHAVGGRRLSRRRAEGGPRRRPGGRRHGRHAHAAGARSGRSPLSDRRRRPRPRPRWTAAASPAAPTNASRNTPTRSAAFWPTSTSTWSAATTACATCGFRRSIAPRSRRMTLDCELPAYIGRKQPPLPVTGVMQIPMGSRVTVRASGGQ